MRKFGLIGYPLGHSFSKTYFTNKFLTESIHDCIYDNYEIVRPDLIKDLIRNDPELLGLNVTIPYKTDIIKFLDDIDDVASGIGAVNVVKVSVKGGHKFLKGFNSDIYGFKESLTPFLQNKKVNKALILGTGGSAKAVAFVLNKLGIGITYASRLSSGDSISYNDLTEKIIKDNHLIVNTTPLGMFPNILVKPEINYTFLTTKHILYDLIYNPELTAFLQKGKERGCTIIGGLAMLKLQADKSWEIWNDDSY